MHLPIVLRIILDYCAQAIRVQLLFTKIKTIVTTNVVRHVNLATYNVLHRIIETHQSRLSSSVVRRIIFIPDIIYQTAHPDFESMGKLASRIAELQWYGSIGLFEPLLNPTFSQ